MKVIELLEARRNPHLNPTFDALTKLKQIAHKYGTEGIYVRFSGIPKLGVNPQSKWGTPFGICAYPLDYVIEAELRVPYAGNMKYLIVFKLKPTANILDLNSSINPNILNTWFNAIKFVTHASIKKPDNFNTYLDMWNYMYNCIRGEQYDYKNEVGHEKNKDGIKAYNIFRHMKVDGIIDHGQGIIQHNEPHQGIFFNTKSLQLVSIIDKDRGKSQLIKLNTAQEAYEVYQRMCDEEDSMYAGDEFSSGEISALQALRHISNKPTDVLARLAAGVGNIFINKNPANLQFAVHPEEVEYLTQFGLDINGYNKVMEYY